MGVPVVVLTHRLPEERPNFVFIDEGIEAAVARAKEIAGDKDVVVNGGQMARQALEAGLIDEIGVELVPVLLGGGDSAVRGPGHRAGSSSRARSGWSRAPA